MSRLETLGPSDWEQFLAAPYAVLVLGKSDCDNCAQWTAELSAHLDDESRWPNVRFGKLLLDTPGLVSFKRANPWIADLDVLPYTVIYVGGARSKEFAGGGADRLDSRLRRLVESG